MGLFRRSTPLPVLRSWEGDIPSFAAARACLRSGDLDGLHRYLDELSLADRFEGVRLVDQEIPYSWALSRVRQDPDDVVALLLAGASAVFAGWSVRTQYRAQHVSDEQFRSFWSWLQEAESHLVRAAELDPADPAPIVYLLKAARGLQRPRDEVEVLFADLLRRDPDHLEGHRQRLLYSCAKWFGTHEEMFAFARGVSESAGAGSALHELVLQAHIERQITLDDARAKKAYFRLPAVAEEVALVVSRLSDLLIGPVDRRSIVARNHLAFVAWACQDRDAFVNVLRDAGGVVSSLPWEYFEGEPVAVVQRLSRTL